MHDHFLNQIRVGIPKTHEYSIEDLLYKYGVDIHFQGHEHSYERMWPVYNHTVSKINHLSTRVFHEINFNFIRFVMERLRTLTKTRGLPFTFFPEQESVLVNYFLLAVIESIIIVNYSMMKTSLNIGVCKNASISNKFRVNLRNYKQYFSSGKS